jgi:hypothetical protein
MGTNGFIAERQIRALLDTLHDRETVVLVNAHAPRRWVGPNNELLARVARDYPNVRLVDWSRISAAHPEYFVADNIHLTGPGLRAYTGAIQAAAGFLPPSRFTAAANYAALAASTQSPGAARVALASAATAPAKHVPEASTVPAVTVPADTAPADTVPAETAPVAPDGSGTKVAARL